MSKKPAKPIEPDVAAATPPAVIEPIEPEVSEETPPEGAELDVAAEAADERLTSDDRGEPAGRVLAVAGTPDASPAWKPGSCINCGETTTDAVQVVAAERYRCTRCTHEWTLAEEQAPFRRLARR